MSNIHNLCNIRTKKDHVLNVPSLNQIQFSNTLQRNDHRVSVKDTESFSFILQSFRNIARPVVDRGLECFLDLPSKWLKLLKAHK